VRRIRQDFIVLAASLAVFTGCAVIAADGRVGPAERTVFHAINGLPGWLYRPMLAAQYLGVVAMPLVVAAGPLVWRRCRLAAALVLVVPLKLVLERVAKQLVQRQQRRCGTGRWLVTSGSNRDRASVRLLALTWWPPALLRSRRPHGLNLRRDFPSAIPLQ
jgi:hypothetical protein